MARGNDLRLLNAGVTGPFPHVFPVVAEPGSRFVGLVVELRIQLVDNVSLTGDDIYLEGQLARLFPDVDEFEAAGLTAVASLSIRPPMVGESRGRGEWKASTRPKQGPAPPGD